MPQRGERAADVCQRDPRPWAPDSSFRSPAVLPGRARKPTPFRQSATPSPSPGAQAPCPWHAAADPPPPPSFCAWVSHLARQLCPPGADWPTRVAGPWREAPRASARSGVVVRRAGCPCAAAMIAPPGVSPWMPPFRLPLPPASARCRPASLLRVYSSGKNHEPQPPRITKDVKRNLHLLKIFKEFAKKQTSTSARPTTSYRKKKIDKQDMPDGADNYEDPTTKLYHTCDGFELATPVLLVDGYNMCGYWPKLKKHFSRGQLETARDKLIHELITFTHIKGVKVVCVFDAVMSGMASHKEVVNSVDVIFSANADSDSWIEREVTLLRADGCPKVWVATSDNFHQQAAHGAGAYIWSCKNLISEINDAKKELQELLHDESTVYSTKGKLLEHNLDPEVRDALQALKQQLRETTQ